MPNMCDSDVMLDEVLGALIANRLDPKKFEAVSRLIRTYGDLRVKDAEINRKAQQPDQWKKQLPGYYPNNTAL